MPNVEHKTMMIPLSEIWVDSEWNSRGLFAPADVIPLSAQIKERGLIHPVLVTDIADELKANAPPGTKYRLVAGYRRFLAHQILNWSEIRSTYDPSIAQDVQRQSEINLIENISRQDLDIMQEAKALLRMYGAATTDKSIANRLNVSPGWVAVRRIVLQQPEDIQAHIAKGVFNQEQIKKLEYMAPDLKYAFVQQILDAKVKGQSTRQVMPPKQKKQYKSKSVRKTGEISEMLEFLYFTFQGAPEIALATRALAWACGNVDYVVLYADLYEFAEKEGYVLEVPNEILGEVMAEVRFRQSKRRNP